MILMKFYIYAFNIINIKRYQSHTTTTTKTTGLMLIPRTQVDANEIAQHLETQCFHAEWDSAKG